MYLTKPPEEHYNPPSALVSEQSLFPLCIFGATQWALACPSSGTASGKSELELSTLHYRAAEFEPMENDL